MKLAKTACLCFASVLMMSMALAGTASAAELLWLVCLEGSGLTKYESSTCLKAASGGKWQSVGVTKEVTVKVTAISILLADTKTTLGKIVVNCSSAGSRGEGVIKSNGEGEIRVAEYTGTVSSECKDEEKVCPEVTALKGANLPWKTKIFVGTNGEPLTKIEPGSSGKQPGWEVTCKDIINVTDTCTSNAKEEEEARLVNFKSATELLVIGLFQTAHKAHCTQSGENTGEVKGSVAILLPGGALSITSP